jgi:hypothetical protein
MGHIHEVSCTYGNLAIAGIQGVQVGTRGKC